MTAYSDARVSWRWNLGIWSIPIVLAMFASYANAREAGRAVAVGEAVLLGIGGWVIWPVVTPFIVWLGQRWPLDRRKRWRFVGGHLAAAAGVGILTMAISGVAVYRGPLDHSFVEYIAARVAIRAPMGSFLYFLVLGISYLAINTKRLQERELVTERLSRELAEAELAALRMQLQPHFIFNTLNAVIALVRDQAMDRADLALTRLSEVLRTTLRFGAHPRITLREEVAFIRNYLDIETLRFGDRLKVAVSIPAEACDAMVPTFVLQPLVENALKHGLLVLPDGGMIQIGAEKKGLRLTLSVVDNGVGMPVDWDDRAQRGVGIMNLRARLAHMYGDAGKVTIAPSPVGSGTHAMIELPFDTA